jgi:hypothetical protein
VSQIAERPNVMRAEVVDSYIKSIMEDGAKMAQLEQGPGNWIKIIETMIKLNIDNRILNNLRQTLNEMITDEKGIVETYVFKKLFFTYFTNDKRANVIYEMLRPAVSIYWDAANNKQIDASDPRASEADQFIKIQLLTRFIDTFNFYPVRVNKFKTKNDSNEVTYVMSSGEYGTRNDLYERIAQPVSLKSLEEIHLLKLLALVSDKI